MSLSYINSNKLQHHLDSLHKWSKGELIPPITVEIQPSAACNHRCYYCMSKEVQGPITMTEEQIRIAVSRLCLLGVKGLIISGGGEPLVCQHTMKAIETAHAIGMDVGLITNGVLLDYDKRRVVLDKCTWIRFSIDAASTYAYTLIRGRDDLREVQDNIHTLLEMRRRRDSKTTIGVQMVVNDYNHGEIKAFYDYWVKTDVDYIQLRPIELRSSDAITFQKEVFQFISEYPFCSTPNSPKLILSDRYKMDVSKIRKYPCLGHQFIGAVDVKGDMYLCCHLIGKASACYGNVFNEEDWVGEEWKIRRKKAFESIDYDDCPFLCRGAGINSYLNRLKEGFVHENFL